MPKVPKVKDVNHFKKYRIPQRYITLGTYNPGPDLDYD